MADLTKAQVLALAKHHEEFAGFFDEARASEEYRTHSTIALALRSYAAGMEPVAWMYGEGPGGIYRSKKLAEEHLAFANGVTGKSGETGKLVPLYAAPILEPITPPAESGAAVPAGWRPTYILQTEIDRYRKIEADLRDFDGDRRGISAALYDAGIRVLRALGTIREDDDPDLLLVPIAVRAILAAIPKREEIGEASLRRVRHKKRGSTYRVLGEAEAQVSNGAVVDNPTTESGLSVSRTLKDGDHLTVYQAEHDGKLWARFSDEFEDGRFEDIGEAG